MAWEVTVGKGSAKPIEFGESGGAVEVVMDGRARRVEATQLQPGLWLLNIDGRIVEAGVTDVGGRLEVSIHGQVRPVEIADPRRKALSSAGGRGGGPTVVSSPMPGKIIGILVEVGQVVEAGQGLVVVEAMKMENEYKAPQAGRVAAISVEAGQTIEAGAKLIRLEPLDA